MKRRLFLLICFRQLDRCLVLIAAQRWLRGSYIKLVYSLVRVLARLHARHRAQLIRPSLTLVDVRHMLLYFLLHLVLLLE